MANETKSQTAGYSSDERQAISILKASNGKVSRNLKGTLMSRGSMFDVKRGSV